MEYLNAVNVITVIIVLLMLYFLKKLFTGDIGDNRVFSMIAIICLGAGLYLWRSGTAANILAILKGAV